MYNAHIDGMNAKPDTPSGYVTGVLGATGGYDEGHLIAADDYRRLCGIATFLKAPLLESVADPTIGIVGIPFDGGARALLARASARAAFAKRAFASAATTPKLDVRPHMCTESSIAATSWYRRFRSPTRTARSRERRRRCSTAALFLFRWAEILR